MCLWFFMNRNRNAAHQRKWTEIILFLPIAAGQFCLHSYLADIGHLGISQRLSYTLYKLPIRYLIALRHFPVAFLYPFSSAWQLSNSPSEHFPVATRQNVTMSVPFLWRAAFLLTCIQIQRSIGNFFLFTSGSSPRTNLSKTCLLASLNLVRQSF